MSKYQIQINKPCSEDWYKMTAQEKGKFCDSCQKTVYNFTQFSNTELARKIKKGDNLCGRFNPEQLNTDLILPQKSYFPKFSYALSIIGLLGFSSPILSQIKTKENTTINWSQSKTDYSNSSKRKKRIIKGKVSDNTGPLPGATIQIKGTQIEVETDFDGNFELVIDKFISIKINITISFLGYKDKSITITNKDFKHKLNVILKEDVILMGEIVIVEKTEPTLFSFLGNLFKKKKKTDCNIKTKKHKPN